MDREDRIKIAVILLLIISFTIGMYFLIIWAFPAPKELIANYSVVKYGDIG